MNKHPTQFLKLMSFSEGIRQEEADGRTITLDYVDAGQSLIIKQLRTILQFPSLCHVTISGVCIIEDKLKILLIYFIEPISS